jgi:WXG100 family type VII secretion target
MEVIMSFLSVLFPQVATSIAGIRQVVQTVEQAALAPISAMAQQVVGGVWKGDGADAFVNELMNIATPKLQKMNQAATLYHTNIGKSRDTIQQADQKVAGLAKNLEEPFNFFK